MSYIFPACLHFLMFVDTLNKGYAILPKQASFHQWYFFSVKISQQYIQKRMSVRAHLKTQGKFNKCQQQYLSCVSVSTFHQQIQFNQWFLTRSITCPTGSPGHPLSVVRTRSQAYGTTFPFQLHQAMCWPDPLEHVCDGTGAFPLSS